MLSKAYIPYKGYYSTPFARWQGSMANEHAIVLAAETSKRWLAEKKWDPMMFDYLFLGITIGQPQWFYRSPWAAAMIGAVPAPSYSTPSTTSAPGSARPSSKTIPVSGDTVSPVRSSAISRTSSCP